MSSSPESKDELMPLRRSTRKSVATKVEEQVLTPKKRKSTATPIKNAPDKNVEAVLTPRRARGTPRKSMGEALAVTPRKSVSRTANEETPKKKEAGSPRKSVVKETSPGAAPKETNRRTPRKSTVVETSTSATPKETKRTTRKSTVLETSPTIESKESTKRTPRKSLRNAKETKTEESEMVKAEEVSTVIKGRRKSVAVSSTKNINTSSDEDSKNTESANEDLAKQSPKRKARKSVHFKKEVDEHQLEPESEFSSSPSPAKKKNNEFTIPEPDKILKSSLALAPKVVLTDISSVIKEGKLAEAVTENMKVGDYPSASETDKSAKSSIDDALLSPSKFLQSDDDEGEDNITISSKVQEGDQSNVNSKSPKVPQESPVKNDVEEHFKSPRRKLSYEIQANDDILVSKACKNLEESELKFSTSSDDNSRKSVNSSQNSVICESKESCQVTTSSPNDATLTDKNDSSQLNAPQTDSLESEVSSTETNALPKDISEVGDLNEECEGLEESKNNLSFTVSSTSGSVVKPNVDLDSSLVPDTHNEEIAGQDRSNEIKISSNDDNSGIKLIKDVDNEEQKQSGIVIVECGETKASESEGAPVCSVDNSDCENSSKNIRNVEADIEELNENNAPDQNCEEHNDSDQVKGHLLNENNQEKNHEDSITDHEEKFVENILDEDHDYSKLEGDISQTNKPLSQNISSVQAMNDSLKLEETIDGAPKGDSVIKYNNDQNNGSNSQSFNMVEIPADKTKCEEIIKGTKCNSNINSGSGVVSTKLENTNNSNESLNTTKNNDASTTISTDQNNGSDLVKDHEEKFIKNILDEDHDYSKVEGDISQTNEVLSQNISSVQTMNDSLKLEETVNEVPESDSVNVSSMKLVEYKNNDKNNESHSQSSNTVEMRDDKTKCKEMIEGNKYESNICNESGVVSCKLENENISNESLNTSSVEDILKNTDASTTSTTDQQDGSDEVKDHEEKFNDSSLVKDRDYSKVEGDILETNETLSQNISSVQTMNDSSKLEETVNEVPASENNDKNNGSHSQSSNLDEMPVGETKCDEVIKGNACKSSICNESGVVSPKFENTNISNESLNTTPVDGILKNNDASTSSTTDQKHLDSSFALNGGDDEEVTLPKGTESLKPACTEINSTKNEIMLGSTKAVVLGSSKTENEVDENVSLNINSSIFISEDDVKTKPESIADSAIQSDLDSSKSEEEDEQKQKLGKRVSLEIENDSESSKIVNEKNGEAETKNITDSGVLNIPSNIKCVLENKSSNSNEITKVVESLMVEHNKTENESNLCQVIQNKDDSEPSQIGENDFVVIENISKETPDMDNSLSQNLGISGLNEDKSICSVSGNLQSPDTSNHEITNTASEAQSPLHSIVDSSTMKNESNQNTSESDSSSLRSIKASPVGKVSEISSSQLNDCNKSKNDFEKDQKNEKHNTSLASSNASSPSVVNKNEDEIASTTNIRSTDGDSEEDETAENLIGETHSEEGEIERPSLKTTEDCSLNSSKLNNIPTSSSSAIQPLMDSSESDSEIIESVSTTDHCDSLPLKHDRHSNIKQETSTLSDSKDDKISKVTSCLKSKSKTGVLKEDESIEFSECSRDTLSDQSLTMEKTTLLGKRRKHDDLIEPNRVPSEDKENEGKKSSSDDSDEESKKEKIKKSSPLGKRPLKSSEEITAKKIKTIENRSKPEKSRKLKKQHRVEKTLVESFLDLEAEEGEESEMSENSSEPFSDSSGSHSPFSSAFNFIQSMAKEKPCHIGTIESLFSNKSLSEDEEDMDWLPPKKKANIKLKDSSSQRHFKDPISWKKDLRHKLEKVRKNNKTSLKECSSVALNTKQGPFFVSTHSEMLASAQSAENIPTGFTVDHCDIYSSPKHYIPKGFVVTNSTPKDYSEVQDKSKIIKKSKSENSKNSSESPVKSSRKQPSNTDKKSPIEKRTKHLGVAVLPFRLRKSEIKKAFGDVGINDIVSVEYASLTTALLQFSEKKSLKKALNLYGQILHNGMPIYVLENKALS